MHHRPALDQPPLGLPLVWHYAIKTSVLILVLVGFGCSRHTNDTAHAIAEHRQKYIALDREYESNYPAILSNEPRRYALVQAQWQEHDALVRLGYLTETNIQFKGEASSFSNALRRASLTDKDLVTLTAPFTTNGLRVTRVSALPADVPALKQALEEQDTK